MISYLLPCLTSLTVLQQPDACLCYFSPEGASSRCEGPQGKDSCSAMGIPVLGRVLRNLLILKYSCIKFNLVGFTWLFFRTRFQHQER
ncbi:hypothetical protein KY290_003469 [Solanum tuberosum]|uniref:Secreted protein n=1 Tax=Solanum tuberosum TaxID=4113 RepID=A0ABQ7WUD8_SOLTU|nr:hypothetical protein KY284_003607 [Solanum tuberosum]KAH0783871.1 hypothetical protein KY290_003469 [Solanum tuberosum]